VQRVEVRSTCIIVVFLEADTPVTCTSWDQKL